MIINADREPIDFTQLDEEYKDFLREVYSCEVQIAGLTYDLPTAWEQLDEVAYHQGFLDYLDDRRDLEEVSGEYYIVGDGFDNGASYWESDGVTDRNEPELNPDR